jgi:hypothetical protein
LDGWGDGEKTYGVRRQTPPLFFIDRPPCKEYAGTLNMQRYLFIVYLALIALTVFWIWFLVRVFLWVSTTLSVWLLA